MRAELMLLGNTINMAPRIRRRWLVAMIYAGFAASLAIFWRIDHCRTSGAYLIFATLIVNRVFLGGHNFGGMIKPFNDKPPRRSEAMPSKLQLVLRIYRPDPNERAYRNDERELDQRNSAHYRAYYTLAITLIILWEMANLQLHIPKLLARIGLSVDLAMYILYGGLLAAVILFFTLPQAILLWTEPDMEPDA